MSASQSMNKAPVANGHDYERFVTSTPTNEPETGTSGRPKGALIVVEPLRKEEIQPSYAYDLGSGTIEHGFYGSFINCLGSCVGACGAIPCCPFPNPYKEVKQGSVGLISRFGKFYKSVDPGLVKVNPLSENVKHVDVKIQITAVPRQTVMTKDNVNVQIDSVIYWHVTNPYKAAFGISDVRIALVERAQTTLRQVVGARPLQSVITEREAIANEIEEIVEAISEKWGVAVESILVKDILFSEELQNSHLRPLNRNVSVNPKSSPLGPKSIRPN